METARRGTWREPDGEPVPFGQAKDAWVAAARDELIETARRYHAYVTYKELAERVQQRSGVRTTSPMRRWIGEVLGRVADDCLLRGEPPLSALCVHADETVGDGYAYVVDIAGGPRPDDLDMHAAEARLDCYRFFGGAASCGRWPPCSAAASGSRSASAGPQGPTTTGSVPDLLHRAPEDRPLRQLRVRLGPACRGLSADP